MLGVVASRHDREAAGLARLWAGDGAALLRAEDLSMKGWRYYPDSPERSVAVVDGVVTPCREITGVLIRRPCVVEAELAHIHPADRPYLAQEMSAFLFAWLSSLTCPMLNRPRDACLLGAPWRRTQWAHAAAQVGIAVQTTPGSALASPAGEGVADVVVVGRRRLGGGAQRFAAQAGRLAAMAGAELMGAAFETEGGAFLGATLRPTLSDPEVVEAVREYLVGGGLASSSP